MGKNNQRRRAAKQRARHQRGPTPPSGGGRPDPAADFAFHVDFGPEARADPAEVRLARLLHAAETQPATVGLLVAEELVGCDAAALQEMDVLASLRLRQALVARWEYGWQPADLLHVVRRSRARLVPLLATAVLAQAAHPSTPPPDRWQDQVVAVADEAVAPAAGVDPDQLVGALLARGGSLVDAWTDVVVLLVALTGLPPLEQLLPPPSAWARGATGRGRAPTEDEGPERARLLNRIRTLLAKAEATSFAAEAETFTAKAQDLMTRHAVDETLLRAGGDRAIDITGVRVQIHNPYAGEKVHLLNQVARANRCRAVWNEPLGLVTVLGTPVDVDQVEMLFTSLLIQATRAMAGAGARRAGSFDRSASFRRSFLMAYAVRIGERLTETTAAATASYGAALVPLLQRQTEAVEAELGRLFPQTRPARAGRYNAVGWEAGREAADQAHLTAGRLTA